jgi:hypothetical protein
VTFDLNGVRAHEAALEADEYDFGRLQESDLLFAVCWEYLREIESIYCLLTGRPMASKTPASAELFSVLPAEIALDLADHAEFFPLPIGHLKKNGLLKLKQRKARPAVQEIHEEDIPLLSDSRTTHAGIAVHVLAIDQDSSPREIEAEVRAIMAKRVKASPRGSAEHRRVDHTFRPRLLKDRLDQLVAWRLKRSGMSYKEYVNARQDGKLRNAYLVRDSDSGRMRYEEQSTWNTAAKKAERVIGSMASGDWRPLFAIT